MDAEERAQLLVRIPPKFANVIAEHVTLQLSGTCDLPAARSGEVVGEIDDGAGVQALIVRIAGTTNRPGGSTYHITWSLDRSRGRKPVESNEVIRKFGWRPLPEPIPIQLRPARF